jgi:RNA polymerase sigma-70 factor (ECF subfamily)
VQDSSTFVRLLNENQGVIHKVCLFFEKDKTDREDLFQEVTLQAWYAYKNFKGEAKFSTWLYKVALNTAISYSRKNKKFDFIIRTNEVPELAEEYVQQESKLEAMYKSISTLSKIDKALLVLYMEDYDYKEIGEILGISANYVAVKMNRIKTKLKEETKKHFQFE